MNALDQLPFMSLRDALTLLVSDQLGEGIEPPAHRRDLEMRPTMPKPPTPRPQCPASVYDRYLKSTRRCGNNAIGPTKYGWHACHVHGGRRPSPFDQARRSQ